MKNMYSAEVQRYGNPIDLSHHPRNTVLGVFNSKDEAENFILEKEAPEQYVEDLGGWIDTDCNCTFLYRIKIVPM